MANRPNREVDPLQFSENRNLNARGVRPQKFENFPLVTRVKLSLCD